MGGGGAGVTWLSQTRCKKIITRSINRGSVQEGSFLSFSNSPIPILVLYVFGGLPFVLATCPRLPLLPVHTPLSTKKQHASLDQRASSQNKMATSKKLCPNIVLLLRNRWKTFQTASLFGPEKQAGQFNIDCSLHSIVWTQEEVKTGAGPKNTIIYMSYG